MRPILLFDGACHLCSSAVQFMLKYEQTDSFLFAPLQSDVGKKLLKDYDIPSDVDSVVVIMNEKAYIYSDAVLIALRVFPYYIRWMRIFRFIPKAWRDSLYRQIAKRRRKNQRCLLIHEKTGRFLQ